MDYGRPPTVASGKIDAVFFRRRPVQVGTYNPATNRWNGGNDASAVDRDELILTTFNVWFDTYFADQRYRAIAQLLSGKMPDVMVFQEITPTALSIFLAQPWITGALPLRGGRRRQGRQLRHADVVPIADREGHLQQAADPAITRIPKAEFTVNGKPLVVCSVHLESGKRSVRLRGRQLRRLFRALRSADDAVVLGDFNMRDTENARITPPYRDVWPMLRPDDDGFTEDTAINHMRYDSKNKHRQVRFDRALLKGHAWAATSINLLGTEAISSTHPRVFPSDHFGVICRLVRQPVSPTGRTGRSACRWFGCRPGL